MAPLVREGDLLEVETAGRSWDIGDVLLFRAAGQTIVHRLVAIRPRTQAGDLLITKADRLCRCDAPIAAEQVVGRVSAVASPRARLRLDGRAARTLGRAVARLSYQQARLLTRLEEGTSPTARLARAVVRELTCAFIKAVLRVAGLLLLTGPGPRPREIRPHGEPDG